MTVAPATSGAEIVRRVRADIPGLVARMSARIRAEVPFYAAGDVVDRPALESSLTDNATYILDGLCGEAGPDGLAAPRATGRARAAAGAPLAELLAGYRIGFAELWAVLVETARASPDRPDTALVDLAGRLFELHSRYAAASVSGYREEYRQLVSAAQRERSALAEAVLLGTVDRGALWEIARTLRLPMQGAFLVVAAETLELGHDPLPRAEPSLAAFDVASVWLLRPECSIGLLALPHGGDPGSVLEALARQAISRVGVSPVFDRLDDAARNLQLAELALAAQEPGSRVEQFDGDALSILVASAPAAAMETARAVLGGLLDLPADDRDLLLGTVRAWLDAEGSATDAAAVLFCHPNTVRYRLRRVEELTRRSVAVPAQLAELVTALRAWSALPHE